MTIVTVKNKYQVVLPQNLREQVGIQVGDLLEAKVERGRITFTPKSLVDRGIAESLDDFRQGRTCGPFASAREAVASMKKELGKRTRKGGRTV
jgi:AbrB family looped-hinge helix DNA binding protein